MVSKNSSFEDKVSNKIMLVNIELVPNNKGIPQHNEWQRVNKIKAFEE